MAVVELSLSPLPTHVRTARLVVVAAARRAGLDPALVDELRLALGEACTRAVGLHSEHAPAAPVLVSVSDDPGALSVTVTDRGPAAGPAPEDLAEDLLSSTAQDDAGDVAPDLSLALITGLVDDVRVETVEGGTAITMRWPLRPPVPGTPAL